MKKKDGDDELKEKEEKWGIRRGIKYGLVPFKIRRNHVRVRVR
jgi:hypothetical protein